MTTTELRNVVGINARAIRKAAGLTLNTVAMNGRDFGLEWSTGKVGDLEAGRVAPTLQTLVAISFALTQATRTDVTVADLVRHDGHVHLNDGFTILGADLEQAMRGAAPAVEPRDVPATGLDEQRLAKSLHVSDRRLSAEALTLWGHSFARERDRRAGPAANPQKRGRMTRQLKAELQARLDDVRTPRA